MLRSFAFSIDMRTLGYAIARVDTLVGEESTIKPAEKSPKTAATRKKPTGFTDEERAAMREHLEELKAEARRGSRASGADAETAVLAKIASLPQPDRAMAERLHAIIKANSPALSPKTWYGMPAYAKDGNMVCFFQRWTEVQNEIRYARFQRQSEPRRRPHVADRLRAKGADRGRRG
jgi:hypothetical protein